MKSPRINNPQPPFLFPIPTLRLSDTSPTKDFMSISLLQIYGFHLCFFAVGISIYQLEWYLCYNINAKSYMKVNN